MNGREHCAPPLSAARCRPWSDLSRATSSCSPSCRSRPAAVSLTPAVERVRVERNHNAVRDCTSLGAIDTRSGWGNLAADTGFENNTRTLRARVADRGGDTLLILQERGGMMSHTLAEAYRCVK